jgi:hypothetical protein
MNEFTLEVYPQTRRTFKSVIILGVAVLVLLATSTYAFGLLTSQQTLGTTGVTASVNIGLYLDSACTQNLTSIDWGIINAGENVTFTAYVRNQGNLNASLYKETSNWNPSNMSDYLTLSWDYAGQVLEPDAVLPAVFTLIASPTMEYLGSFSFDIVITSYG